MTTSNPLVGTAMSWARTRDERRLRARPDAPAPLGMLAGAWAGVKFAALALTAPLWVPGVLAAATLNHRRAKRDIIAFPDAMSAIGNRRPTHLRADDVIERRSSERVVIFSDLHRCIAGRRDWPARQSTKDLYAEVLERYADDAWTLCENGDVEDFWMVGGSAAGAVYDAGRLLGAACARRDPSVLNDVYRTYLDGVIANNERIYAVLRDRFVSEGRYVRTIGNHDDPLHRPEVLAVLQRHLGDFPIGDFVALRRDGDALECLIAHGHHTDGWNAPHQDFIGKFSTWFGNTIVDVPGLSLPEGLPPKDAGQRLLAAGPRDRLIELHPLIGATSDYDSLDEELLFAAVDARGLADRWLVLGHTHVPMDGPGSKHGGTWRGYVNGGSGIVDNLITGVEWDGAEPEPRPRLVAWTKNPDGELERIALSAEEERRVAS